MFTTQEYHRLCKLMDDLYLCTGMKFGLIGTNFLEYYSSAHKTRFCELIQQSEEGLKRCQNCDKQAVDRAVSTKASLSYRCHAGLTEVVVPVMMGNEVISTIIFGEVLDETDMATQWSNTKKLCKWHENLEELEEAFMDLKRVSSMQMDALQEIVDSCISEVRLSRVIENNKIDEYVKLESLISAYYSRDDILQIACDKLRCGKTTLYSICKKHYGVPFGKAVLKKRLDESLKMLYSSSLPIYRIADNVGIKDVDYFTKLFKKRFGITPSEYRRNHQKMLELM